MYGLQSHEKLSDLAPMQELEALSEAPSSNSSFNFASGNTLTSDPTANVSVSGRKLLQQQVSASDSTPYKM